MKEITINSYDEIVRLIENITKNAELLKKKDLAIILEAKPIRIGDFFLGFLDIQH